MSPTIHREIRNMLRKWTVFALSAGILVSIAGVSFSGADDESELGKLMEKVNKANTKLRLGTRNPVNFKKKKQEVADTSKEMIKLAKEAKPFKDALGKAKNEANPQQKWNELMDAFIDKSEVLSKAANKATPDYDDTKKAFSAVTKTCADCHTVFRVEENF
jgi:cytochrome c556